MRKSMLIILMAALYLNVNAATVPERISTPTAAIGLPDANKLISLSDFLSLTPKEYTRSSGKKLNFFERMKFRMAQKIAKRMIAKNGLMNFSSQGKRKGLFSRWSWHWGGFALGFIPILGPVVCLFFKDDYKWDRFSTALFMNGILASVALIFLQAYGG